MKNSLEGFLVKADLIRQENESANWKTGQWKFSSLKNRKKKDLRKVNIA